ncbi:MAG: 3-keto-5-aminohexanoate cleavage enzyme [Candidatus Azotimanducaceae bacterium]|jgi:3-keto-5-aminohexanoate cleavage enzyme|tara:strand:- start:1914 stop:2759 length:846 start_codon:yes stop_codon:yes gene_type:complete
MTRFAKDFILNVAFTGAVSDNRRNAAVPYTIDEIVADAASCAKAGATIGHFHVRTKSGAATNDPDLYAELFRALRAEPDVADLVLVASTSGRHGQTLEQRAAVLDLPSDARPDMASLTLSSLNFATGPSINHPDDIIALAQKMQANGIVPELEVFDLGMVAYLNHLVEKGTLNGPFYVNAILGLPAGAQADLLTVGTMMAQLPCDALVCLGGVGKWQLPAHFLAVAGANGLRTGLEDNLRRQDGTTLTTNLELTKHAVELVHLAGRRPMRPRDFRSQMLLR